MTLAELLEIIHCHYPDEHTRQCWDDCTGRVVSNTGDTLAEFAVAEIADTFDASADTRDQLREASRVMNRAAETLHQLAGALDAGP